MDVLVVGQGKLAQELLEGVKSPVIDRVLPWADRDQAAGKGCMVVHAGSGREMNEVIEFCTQTHSTLLELSTGDSGLPKRLSFPAVICPNVNMAMLSFMAMVRGAAPLFKGMEIEISESHQASKKTRPGTAVYLARALGKSEKEIFSERDPVRQQEIGIPEPFLDRHAWHQILIREGGVEIKLETRVLGESAYADGLSRIIEQIASQPISPGYHDIVDLIRARPDT